MLLIESNTRSCGDEAGDAALANVCGVDTEKTVLRLDEEDEEEEEVKR